MHITHDQDVSFGTGRVNSWPWQLYPITSNTWKFPGIASSRNKLISRHNGDNFSDLILQHDNARPHTAARKQTYLAGTGVTMLPQSPYRPDMNHCHRFLFTILQRDCRWQQYTDGNELLLDTQRFLRSLSEDMLKLGINKLREHCRAVIREGGAYVTDWLFQFYQFSNLLVFLPTWHSFWLRPSTCPFSINFFDIIIIFYYLSILYCSVPLLKLILIK